MDCFVLIVPIQRGLPGGWAARYADLAGTELPADQQVPMSTVAVFDLASISKLFTTIVVLGLAEDGVLDLDAPVADETVYNPTGDLAVLGQAILGGGAHGDVRILQRGTLAEALTNQVEGLTTSERGLRFELDARLFMGALVGQETAGHTGLTGPSSRSTGSRAPWSCTGPTGCTPTARGARTTRAGGPWRTASPAP